MKTAFWRTAMSLSPYRLALLLGFGLALAAPAAEPPRTVAEKSDYKATSRHADVLAFCEELAKQSPLVRLGTLGTSGEGRKLPLIILADPPVATPEEAARSGKLVVFAFGNIHAGEVDGKEALLALARDLALAKERPLLKNLVIVFAPLFNADGNERIDKGHRTHQNGPEEGVGIRENAAGLDLNRDFVKLETPEVRSLVRFLNKWNPAVVVDTHTTNGSLHRYTLTYDGPRHPAADPALIETVRDKMLPDVGQRLKKAGYQSFFYGNFVADHKRWETYPAEPRYGVQYFGLRGEIGILSESYVYASYRDRIQATRAFVLGCFEYAAEHRDEVRKLTAGGQRPEKIALRSKAVALDRPFTVAGYVEERKDGKRVAGKPRDYELEYLGRCEPTLTVTRPYAYLFPAQFAKAVETLQRHGITVEELREDIELDVEAYRADKVTRSLQAFQKHPLVRVEASARKEARRVPAGTILVRTDQRLGTLAAFLLEPGSEDGLATWNFFENGLAEGQDFPVLRLPAKVPVIAGRVRPLAEERTMNKPIDVKTVYGEGGFPPNFSGNPVNGGGGGGRFGGFGGGLTWLEDGEHFLQVKEGKLYKVHARTGRLQPFLDPEKLAKSLAALPTIGAGTAKGLANATFFRMNPQRTGALFDHSGDLYFGRFDGGPGVRLTKTPGAKEFASFSPDGQFVAFVRGGNLYVSDVATGTQRALTTDGGGLVLNGKADWVYEEEIFNRRGKAYWWSPDSKHIAFLRFDDAPVHQFTVVDSLPTRQRVERTPYPKSGDPNPLVSLHVVHAAGGDALKIDLGDYSPTASLIVRVGWLPDGSRAYCYVQDRAQTWLDFLTFPAGGGTPTRLFRETTKAWVDDPGEPTFLADGSFLLASERSGWRHLYHFDKAGKLLGPVTSGEWEVQTLHAVDAKNGWAYFSGTRDNHNAPNAYRVKLDGGTVERLTPDPGAHAANFASRGGPFIDSFSDPATPTRVLLRDGDGKVLRILDTNPVYLREEYRFGPYERVHVKTRDGFVLEGSLIKPADFNPSKKYPVWIMTYAGPHTPTVREAWEGGRVHDQVLASLGFVVFHVDPRSASGKGACSAWSAYKRLGVQELKDLEEAVDWLCGHSWVDSKRIGLQGHSYGGFMTAYALTHSKKFAAGIAGAPVTDWHNYDSIYTERYMNVPQENKEGYEVTSAVKGAKNLHGRLLILHGLIDDNVHFQNSVQLIDALERADRDFEMMVYPRARHGIGGRHYQRQILQFIQQTLGDKPRDEATSAQGEEQ
jgi:dipeptidyl aminopeptidase/acylaminoacyl peptidase